MATNAEQGYHHHPTGQEGTVNNGADLEDIETIRASPPPAPVLSSTAAVSDHAAVTDPLGPPPPYDGYYIDPPMYTAKADDASTAFRPPPPTAPGYGWTVGPQAYGMAGGYDHHQPPPPQYMGGPDGAVMNQPRYYGQTGGQILIVDATMQPGLVSAPNDYMGCSIFVTFCCCWMIGLSAIQRSRECREAISTGNLPLAITKSREARTRIGWSIGLGVVCLIVVAAIVGVRYGFAYGSY